MKKILCIVILCTILFSGCSWVERLGAFQMEQTEPQQSEKTDQELLAAAEKWLEKDFSFTMTYKYMDLAINGMQQSTEQVIGKDGSWYMLTERRVWDHSTDYNQEEVAQYYYRYEGSLLVCYYDTDGQGPQRTVLSDRDREDLEASKALMIGSPALMPDYLEGLYVTHPTDDDATTVLAYWLPVKNVLADSTMLSAYVNNAFWLSGNTYPPEANAGICVLLFVDTQTCQPQSVQYMFQEVKPYVLSEGAQSGEDAFQTDFMTMEYTFDFNIPDTVSVPDEMIP